MLDLPKLLWIFPGIIFIYIYNRRRPSARINLSGWSYIGFLVVLAVVVWVPVNSLICHFVINETLATLTTVAVSGVISFLLAVLCTWDALSRLFPSEEDIFFIKCKQWEEKTVILSLKNDKIYIGVLLKYPENPRSNYESQMISISPIITGESRVLKYDTTCSNYCTA